MQSHPSCAPHEGSFFPSWRRPCADNTWISVSAQSISICVPPYERTHQAAMIIVTTHGEDDDNEDGHEPI